jgi:ATP-dependent helicase/nuclease subunit B
VFPPGAPLSSRRLIRSSCYAGLQVAAGEFLTQAIATYSEVLVIAPSRGAADDFVRNHCGSGVKGVHRTTLTGLAVDLASAPLAEAGLAPLTRIAGEAITARVIHGLTGRIPYYQRVAHTPGLARAVAATLYELRMAGIDANAVAHTGLPGKDVALIAAGYEQQLERASLADFPILLQHARAVAEAGGHRFSGIPVILLGAAIETRRARDLVQAVIGRSPSVFAAYLRGDEQSGATYADLLGVAGEDIPDAAPETTLRRIRTYLFAADLPDRRSTDETLDYFSAAGEGLECVEIARRIRALAAAGMAFDRMAILLRSPERYQPLVEEALRRAGIPAWFSRGVARPDPAGRAFLALLACASERCSASRFAEYLSLGQASAVDAPPSDPGAARVTPEDEILAAMRRDRDPEQNAPAAPDGTSDPDVFQAPGGWEKLLVDAAVIGGRERWARRLKGLEQEMLIKAASIKDPDDAQRMYLERYIEKLQTLERFALPLIERLDSLPEQASWGVWLGHLEELARVSLRRPETVLSLLSELQSMDEVGPVQIDEVYDVLSDRLRFLRREPPARRYGRVFVGGIEEARACSFEAVFLPGLAEGVFPRKTLEDPILLDTYRAQLDRKLMLQEDRVSRERLLLHIAAASAKSRLIFSYPRIDVANSRPRVPSFYALEIARAALGRLPELREFEKTAGDSAPSRLDWPAPLNPREAIDDAEFDLSYLARFSGRERDAIRARGRYLIEANTCLVRHLRTRASRWRPKWSTSDGLVAVDNSPARAILEQHRLAARSYSPSALQHYSACPYRFALYAIHQLRERDEAVAIEQMDPLTRGELFHRVQFELFRTLDAQGLLPLSPERLAEVSRIADAVLNRLAAEYQERLAPAIPRVWNTEIEDMRSDLRGWLQHIASDVEWQPAYFEFAFGLKHDEDRDPRSAAEPARLDEGVVLRGSIDLIERHTARGSFRVTDHKTGKAPDDLPQYVGGGAVLQPLLYAMAAGKLLGAPVESGRLSYCTQRGGYAAIEIPVTPQARARVQRVLETIDDAIRGGFLPAAPQRDACGRCDYRAACGPYEERRTARKHPGRVEPLVELRNMP